jgi:predicted ATP-dependent protease
MTKSNVTENLIVNIAEIARDMRGKPSEDFCDAIEPLIQAHTESAVAERTKHLQARVEELERVCKRAAMLCRGGMKNHTYANVYEAEKVLSAALSQVSREVE